MNFRRSLAFSVYILYLIIPFLIYRKTYYEPYPAIIFPGGWRTAAIDSQYVILKKYLIYAVLDNQSKELIDENRLLSSLPIHYREPFWGKLFNKYEGYRKFEIKIGSHHIYQIEFPPQLTSEQKKRGRLWLRNKIQTQLSEKNAMGKIEMILLRRYKEFYPVLPGLPEKPMELIEEMTMDIRN